jgi:F-type H+-transporting ATPase subunit b
MTLGDAGLFDLNGTFIVELIVFIVMVWILGKWVYPRVMAAAEGRQRQIDAALQEAERTRREVAESLSTAQHQIEEAKSEATNIINRARKEASAEAEEQRQRGREEAEAQLERARADITAERDRAVREVRAEAAQLVVTAAGQVLGQAIDASTHQRLIEESLERVSANGKSEH